MSAPVENMSEIKEEAEEVKDMELDLDEGIRAAMEEPKPILKAVEKAEVYSNESFGSDELNNSICDEAHDSSDDDIDGLPNNEAPMLLSMNAVED